MGRKEHVIEGRSAGNVAEVARVLQLPELIEVGPKGPCDGGFTSLVQAAPQVQERLARHILHDDIRDDSLKSSLVDGIDLGDRHRRGLCHVQHVMGLNWVDINAEFDDESLLHLHNSTAGRPFEQDLGAVDVIWSRQRIGTAMRLVHEQDMVWPCVGHDKFHNR